MSATDPPPAASDQFVYHLGPFRFHSQLEIPELRAIPANASAPAIPPSIPVHITAGNVPNELRNAAPYGKFCQVSSDEYLLRIPGIANYYVARGNEVRVAIAPNAPAADVSAYLLGSIFGALCHQNEMLPLHASAIAVDARATAFLGESGAGKSTLAACLEARSHTVVSDDICLLAPPADPAVNPAPAPAHIIPVAGWLKLWRQSFDHLGQAPEAANRVFRADDKFRRFLPPSAPDARPTLANLVFLARAPSPDAPPTLTQLPAVETIALMMRLTYLGYITELTGSHARVFRQCAAALAGAKSFRLTLPWNLAKMDQTLDLIESDLLQTNPREVDLHEADLPRSLTSVR